MSEMISVATDAQRAARRIELAAQDRDREAAATAAKEASRRSNEGFVQVYPKGWARMQTLIRSNPAAARVYAFLAEHIDGVAGAVVVSQDVMANALGVHVRTIQRQTSFLEGAGALVRIKVGTGVYAYALDPDEVWRSYGDKKELAAFYSKTLVPKSARENRAVGRKLRHMMGQPELDLGDDR